MELNNDGLEPGQPVDFETLQRIKSQHKHSLKNAENVVAEQTAKQDEPQQGAQRGRKSRNA